MLDLLSCLCDEGGDVGVSELGSEQPELPASAARSSECIQGYCGAEGCLDSGNVRVFFSFLFASCTGTSELQA